MKKMILKLGSSVAALALMVTVINANTTCMFVAYQPTLPETARKLRKF